MLATLPVYTGAIVHAPDGRILCQLRDDIPGIVCPGLWCPSPGGRLEPGESPADGIRRELREEFAIQVGDLKPLHVHTESEGEYAGIYHAFVTGLQTPMAQVQCLEGQRVEFFAPEQALQLPQHPVSRLFVELYLAGRES